MIEHEKSVRAEDSGEMSYSQHQTLHDMIIDVRVARGNEDYLEADRLQEVALAYVNSLLAIKQTEIEALKARQVTPEIREAIQQALRSYAIDLDISGSLPEAYHELFALLKPLAQEGKL